MKPIQAMRNRQPFPGWQGMWLVLIPAPLLLVCRVSVDAAATTSILLPALLASLALLGLALLQDAQPRLAKGLGLLGLIACGHSAWPLVIDSPFAALLAGVGLIQAVFFLLDLPNTPTPPPHHREIVAHTQARKGLQTLVWLSLGALLLDPRHAPLGQLALAAASLISQILVGRWLHTVGKTSRSRRVTG